MDTGLSLAANGLRDDAGAAVARVVDRDAVLYFDVQWNELTTLSGAPLMAALGESRDLKTLTLDEHAVPRRNPKKSSKPASAAVRMVQRRRPTQGVPQKLNDLSYPVDSFHYRVKQGVVTLIRRAEALPPRHTHGQGHAPFHV